jgi:hypothetical protein
MFGRFFVSALPDYALRIAVAMVSFLVLLWPDEALATMAAVPTAVLTILGIWRHRLIAAPEATAAETDIHDESLDDVDTKKINLVGEG